MKKILLIGLFVLNVNAQADDYDDMEIIANEFAGCVGVFKAFAKASPNDPALAESLMGYSRGAKLAAAYLFANMRAIKDGTSKPYADYYPQVESIAFRYYKQAKIQLEAGNSESMEAALMECADLNEVQTKIIQDIREDAYEN
ncbi:MAG: hypothetical protein DRQ48_07595 [Gammaproteobacteria bacterium]|nr:MAG: hypothetical protein DRQ58_07345 [Gammaproteobacteria bacterium]RKZ69594.1 MAG: hypothetical protein DRQ48_07595 [Gammaproteobacteria bacterium]